MITDDSMRALEATRAPAGGDRQSWRLSPAMIAFVSANATLIVAAVFALASFGSIRSAVGFFMRGETLLVDANEKSFGVAAPGRTLDVQFRLTNRGDDPIRILGCKTLCTCTVPRDLPYTLGPKESRDLNITVNTFGLVRNGEPTDLYLPLTLFTTNRAQSRVGLAIRGEVREKPIGAH